MRVVIAPDKFKGTLTAPEAAQAMASGWTRARPGDDVVCVPLADGGDGFVGVVASAVAGTQRITAEVADAAGHATSAEWALLPDGRAVIESAQACGLARLAEDRRDPMTTTTYGVGQLLRAAVDRGATRIVVGLGGSATVDGGAGMALALGHRLLRADGNGVKVGARHLRALASVVPGPPLGVPVVAAVDVRNPLLGADGAAAVFGPQKGARPQDVPVLEEGLARLADVVERDLPGGPWRDLPGAGAAGGLGFGLAAFCAATFELGAAVVDDLVGFSAAAATADVVVTGEGALDAQTEQGKVPAHVLASARAAGARVLAVAGHVDARVRERYDATAALGPEGLEHAAALVAQRTEELARRL